MTAPAQSLTAATRAAAAYIDIHGWTQGQMEDDEGRVCLTGAIKQCAPIPGDFALAREVHRHRGRAESWNDDEYRERDEVSDYLATTEITDADLEDTFGPQWRVIVTVVRTNAAATLDQAQQADAFRRARTDDVEQTAWDAAAQAAAAADRVGPARRAWDVGYGLARNAAFAYAVADLVGESGFTVDHFAVLTGPYVSVFGEPEPVAS